MYSFTDIVPCALSSTQDYKFFDETFLEHANLLMCCLILIFYENELLLKPKATLITKKIFNWFHPMINISIFKNTCFTLSGSKRNRTSIICIVNWSQSKDSHIEYDHYAHLRRQSSTDFCSIVILPHL